MSTTTEQPKIIVNLNVQQAAVSRESFVEGYIGIVTIGTGWGFSTSVTPEMLAKVLGKDGQEAAKEMGKVTIIEPGKIWLVPDDVIGPIQLAESQARTFISKNALKFGKDKVHFIHHTKIAEVLLGMDVHQETFRRVFDEKLVQPYEEIKDRMRNDYPDLWPLMEGAYPTVAKLKAGLKFRFTVREMILPQNTQLVDPKVIYARVQADKAYAERLQMDAEEVKMRLERSLQEQNQSKAEEFRLLVEDTVKQLRGRIVEVFENILDRRSEKKEIGTRQLTSIREAIAHVEALDFVNDTQFRDRLNAVKQMVDSGRNFITSEEAAQELEGILKGTIDFANTTMETSIGELTQTYFSARKLSL